MPSTNLVHGLPWRALSLLLLLPAASCGAPEDHPELETRAEALRPTADGASFETDEDVPVSGTLTGDDGDGDTLTFRVTQQPARGSVSVDVDSGAFTYTPTPNLNGEDTFRFVVNDGVEDSDEAFVEIDVAPVNDAPNIDGVADRTVAEGATLAFQIIISDVDGDDVDAEFTLPQGAAIDGENFTWTPTFNQAGTHALVVTASDNETTTVATATVTVTNTNRAPTIGNLDAPGGLEGDVLTFSATANDPDGDQLLYTWNFGDGTGATGSTVQHVFRDNDSYDVSVTVTDAEDTVAAAQTIQIQNAPPIVESLENRGASEGDTLSFTGSAEDPGDDTLTYAWSFGDGNTAIGRQANHRYPADGTYTVELTVTDDDGGSGASTAMVTVANVAPSVTLPPHGQSEGALFVLRAEVNDPGADALTYAWDLDGDGETDSTSVNPTLSFGTPGSFPIQVAVHDGVATTTANGTATITNVPPAVGAITAAPTAPQEAQVTTLATTSVSEPGSDPDDLTYTWRFGDGNEQTGQGLRSVTHAWTAQGTYTVELVVDDGDGAPTTVTRLIQVDNAPPQITPGDDVDAAEGGQLTMSATASDPGGDTLTWTWNFGDGETETGVGLDSVTHTYADQGEYPVRVVVDDLQGGTASATMTATITNVAPTVTADPERIVAEGTHTFSVQASDPGLRDTLNYDWEVTCEPEGCLDTVAFVGPHGGVDRSQVQIRFGRQGAYSVRTTVTDKDGASGTATTSVTVDGAAPALSLEVLEDTISEGGTATLVATASDPLPLTWSWDFGDGNQDAVPAARRQHNYVQDGVYTVRVTVTAEDGDSADAQVQVTVQNAAPIVALGAVSANEGAATVLVANTTDPGVEDVLSWAWDFGDGQTATTDVPTVSHTWAQDGDYTVTVTVSDEADLTGQATASATIANVGPALQLPPTAVALEGVSTPLSGIASDPGEDPLTWTWTFGEGLPEQSGVDLRSVTPTFLDDGVFTVTVVVTDGIEEATAEMLVEVLNAAPTLAAPEPVSGVEGAGVTFSNAAFDVDADPLTYAWDFGDGLSETGEGLSDVSHAYADNGTYVVTLTVTDGDGGQVQNTRIATIANSAPTLEEPPAPRTVDEGAEATFEVSPQDDGADTIELCWTFGDDEPERCGVGLSAVTHAWADNGAYALRVELTDDDGDSTQYETVVTVTNVAPTGTLTLPRSVFEGTPTVIGVDFDDPGADTLTMTWDFEPGDNDDQSGVELAEVSHAYSNDGTAPLLLVIDDGDGGTLELRADIEVQNVPPAFQTRPILYVQPGEPYRYDALATDPADEVTYALIDNPLGMALGDDGLITWTAPADPTTADVQLDALDGDASTSQSWTIQVGYEDADGDGAPDECERAHGLNPNDPDDGAQDADGDGATNAEECLRGDDPRLREGPQPPSVHAPLRGAIVSQAPVEMVVNNSPGVQGEVSVAFQLFADAQLRELVDEIVVPLAEPRTSWLVDRAFEENGRYYWRARTLAPEGNSAWSRPSLFLFSAVNDAPPAPTLTAPRGPIQEAFPTFVLTAPRDPEDEILHVELEVRNASDAVIAGTTWDAIGGEELRFTLPGDIELVEDHPYTWQARAMDVRRNEGPWSAPVAFRLNNLREAPPAPQLLVPADGAVLRVDTGLNFIATTVVDPDGDTVVYDFQIRLAGEFETIIAEAFGLQVDGGDDVVVWSPNLQGNLAEDQTYTWSVQARDNAAASPKASGTFRFSADDLPPRQVEVISPQAGARVSSLAESLVWFNVDDPEGQSVHYTVEIWRDLNRTELQQRVEHLTATGPEGTEYTWTGAQLEDNREYYWRVKAIDAGGVEAPWSGLSPFLVDVRPQAPAVPQLLRPATRGDAVANPEVELAWSSVADPEGEEVSYAVEVFDAADSRIATADVPDSGSAEVTWTTPALPAGATYTWRVLATDGSLVSAWSDSAGFRIQGEAAGVGAEEIPDAPRATSAPADSGCNASGSRISWTRIWMRR